MDEIRLPHHVVDRLERRWTGRFAQMLKGLTEEAEGFDLPGSQRVFAG